MPVTLVQSKTAYPGGTSTPAVATFDGATTTGNLIEVTVELRQDAAGGVTVAVTDNKGNTYSPAVTSGGAGAFSRQCVKFYCANTAGGGSHQITVTPSGSLANGSLGFVADEWSGLAPSGPLDKTATGTNTSTAVSTGSTGTLSQADELVTCGVGTAGTSVTYTPGVGWTQTAATTGLFNQYKVVAGTAAVSGDATASPSITWNAALATYKIAAGGGGPAVAPIVAHLNRLRRAG
ncbi:hypothetical protein J0H58_28930 [bacterium]|nr:hypothetical protein [bacterium]